MYVYAYYFFLESWKWREVVDIVEFVKICMSGTFACPEHILVQ